jgi:hydroxypyruvate reductase
MRSAEQLRDDALRIWQAGLAAVRSDRLVRDALRIAEGALLVADNEPIDLATVRRIVVVGAGKAGAGMAAAVEEVLGPKLMAEKHLTGWVNVPADCVRKLERIHLHAAREAGRNEPTAAGVYGAERILQLVSELGPNDLCLCLISGGASALLPAPVEGITLDDKLAVTRHLSAAGANIRQLNTVRKQLSRIKGGELCRACRAGRLIALVISDVIGDPLEVIGSGPTVPDRSTPAEALAVLEAFHAREAGIAPRVFEYLKKQRPAEHDASGCPSENVIIGNNALAVDAAGVMAEQLGYSHAMHCATELEGTAEEVGRHLARMARRMQQDAGPDCLITGGEPVVKLVREAERGLGGRNQQLVLAAAVEMPAEHWAGIVLLSGATDGEDGPTDAAGAWVDAGLLREAIRRGLDATDFLRRNDAYHFFEPLGGLIKTGPTHTNVCDLRVVVVSRVEARQ